MSIVPVMRTRIVRNTQGSDAPGQTANWLGGFHPPIAQRLFPNTNGEPAVANALLYVDALHGGIDEWWIMKPFIWPDPVNWNNNKGGGAILNGHNHNGDIGWGDSYNGVPDMVAPHLSDGTSAVLLPLWTTQSLKTTLTADYHRGTDTTMQVASTAGFDPVTWSTDPARPFEYWGAYLNSPTRGDHIAWQSSTSTAFTGVDRAQIQADWPAGSTVVHYTRGLQMSLEYYGMRNGTAWTLPDGVPGQWYFLLMHFIFGRTDGTTARPGSLVCYVNGSDTKWLDLQNIDNLQHVSNYYKTNGPYTQRYLNFWDIGPYVFSSASNPGPWIMDAAMASFGTTLSEAVSDAPSVAWATTLASSFAPGASGATLTSVLGIPHNSGWGVYIGSGSDRDYIEYQFTSGNTLLGTAAHPLTSPSRTWPPGTPVESVSFFKTGTYKTMPDGTPYGTFNDHIPNTTPDFGPTTFNMTYNNGILVPVSVPVFNTANFPIPPSLGGGGGGTGVAPARISDPAVTGTLASGNTVTSTDGSVSGSPAPTVVARQWEYTYDNIRNFPFPGENATTMALTKVHIGRKIRSRIVWQNATGSVELFSPWTAVVPGPGGNWLARFDAETDVLGVRANNPGDVITRSTTVTH